VEKWLPVYMDNDTFTKLISRVKTNEIFYFILDIESEVDHYNLKGGK
jgi:hypothetical protein